MKKAVNYMVITIVVLIAVVGAIFVILTQQQYSEADELFTVFQEEEHKEYNARIAKLISIAHANQTANQKGELDASVKPSGGNKQEVAVKPVFNNFFEMYSYTQNHFNKAKYVLSRGSGAAYNTGSSLNGLISVTNKKMSINFVRAKTPKDLFYDFVMRGVMVEGMPEAVIASQFYSDYRTYSYNSQDHGINKTTLFGFQNFYKWNMQDLFHIINEQTVASVDSFFFDPHAKTYKAKITLDPVKANTDFSVTMEKFTDSSEPLKFNKTELEIIVGEWGELKQILYNYDFNAVATHTPTGISFSVRSKATYTEYFEVVSDTQTVFIKQPDFAK